MYMFVDKRVERQMGQTIGDLRPWTYICMSMDFVYVCMSMDLGYIILYVYGLSLRLYDEC